MIITPKRKIVARKLLNGNNDFKEYLIAIDSISPTPNKRLDRILIMKKIIVN